MGKLSDVLAPELGYLALVRALSNVLASAGDELTCYKCKRIIAPLHAFVLLLRS